jgi:co-chaperonin GroES (HSP10)|tara:strand:+ start:1700 stop:2080 length:381 start_codon:yes stop_codon:yes gene_type:complete
MNLEATFNAVIVKPLEEVETKYGSIVVPDIGKDKNEHGEVISVGPGQHTISGAFIETSTKVGDIVILPTQGFTKLEHDGVDYYVGPENQILAKVKKVVDVGSILESTEVTKAEKKELSNIKLEDNE